VSNRDAEIRLAAFARCRRLLDQHGGAVPWGAIQDGFRIEGEHIHLGSTPRGIHRPAQMRRGVLSIKTTKPKRGRTARYDDALGDDGDFIYAFQGEDPNSRDNAALREAFEDQTPLIYFYALVPGVYDILFSRDLTDWDGRALRRPKIAARIRMQSQHLQVLSGLDTTQRKRETKTFGGMGLSINSVPVPDH
jgi:putative restriction endonuclease